MGCVYERKKEKKLEEIGTTIIKKKTETIRKRLNTYMFGFGVFGQTHTRLMCVK
tara:strand:+ start:353 stop:514 length:162 start_codon:yes stop_codon:yes gene_type:complete